MKLSALRQLMYVWRELPDDIDLAFMSDGGDDFYVGTAQYDRDNSIIYFGETDGGLAEAYGEYLRTWSNRGPSDDDEEDEDPAEDDGPFYGFDEEGEVCTVAPEVKSERPPPTIEDL